MSIFSFSQSSRNPLCISQNAVFLWSLLVALLITNPVAGEPDKGSTPFRFALLGDPQLGYGTGGVYADARRFSKVIQHSNSTKLPLIIILGDLVQTKSIWQRWAFSTVLKEIDGHILLTPGNHDVVDVESLEVFRQRYGADYHDYVFHNSAFILINSETARNSEISQSEFETQWRWLEEVAARHARAGRDVIFFVTHRPPFVMQEDEPSNEGNWPKETRSRLLDLARQYGVQWILSGHLHRTQVASTQDGIRIVVLSGTAKSFDRSPIGYGLFEVSHGSVHYAFQEVAKAPEPPFSVPGFTRWTPRLFDFSLRHWLLTVAYLAAAVSAFVGRRRLLRFQSPNKATARLWGGIGALMAFYGINMQLDIDEFITEIGRAAARLGGLYPIRHAITAVILLVLLVVALGYLIWNYSHSHRDTRTRLAIGMLFFPTAYFFLGVASNHNLGLLFDEGLWDLLNLGAVITVTVTGLSIHSKIHKG